METIPKWEMAIRLQVAMSPGDFLDYAAKQIVAKGWSLSRKRQREANLRENRRRRSEMGNDHDVSLRRRWAGIEGEDDDPHG